MASQKFLIVLLIGGALFTSALGAFSFLEEFSLAPVTIRPHGEVRETLVVKEDRTGGNVLLPVKGNSEAKFSLEDNQANDEESIGKQEHVVQALLLAPGVSYNLKVQEGSNVFDLMKAAEDAGFRFRGKHFAGLGFFVEEINGLAQNPREGKYWIYYINGEKAPVGVSQYILQSNDAIQWKYEANQ